MTGLQSYVNSQKMSEIAVSMDMFCFYVCFFINKLNILGLGLAKETIKEILPTILLRCIEQTIDISI